MKHNGMLVFLSSATKWIEMRFEWALKSTALRNSTNSITAGPLSALFDIFANSFFCIFIHNWCCDINAITNVDSARARAFVAILIVLSSASLVFGWKFSLRWAAVEKVKHFANNVRWEKPYRVDAGKIGARSAFKCDSVMEFDCRIQTIYRKRKRCQWTICWYAIYHVCLRFASISMRIELLCKRNGFYL